MQKSNIDGNAIIERLSAGKRDDRKKVSLYLSKSLYNELKKNSNGIPASVIIEELISQFNQSVKSAKKS